MGEVRVRSGRQARQAERAHKGGGMGRPYIVRNIPTYDVLSEEDLLRIEAAADRVLAETGIEKFAQERGAAEVDEKILDEAKDFFGM